MSSKSSSSSSAQTAQDVLHDLYRHYVSKTPQRVKLIDAFMAFLVGVGVLQFVYCVLVGNYVSSFFFFSGSLLRWSGAIGRREREGGGRERAIIAPAQKGKKKNKGLKQKKPKKGKTASVTQSPFQALQA